ncbi:MAG TPA: DUF3078 domain-containing protein [Candidatus Alistipes avicola]|uniref:DUF3078 domain-containing protein n=1 Tax=Candidatus Alistipes avicola TaxID=2838432 RepID=A0A9D2ICP9_9BACT|nr:DUF3078 domain-containing protein [uncultured Alistipes sp.]HJA98825.1 DUF3078 domain-containing protein [Candidatus Alistipes avicola]
MKRIYPILSLLVLLGISVPAAAQITIEVDETQNTPPTTILDTQVKNSRVDANSYFSQARYRAERAAIRKERNKLELGGGVMGSVASYSDSWIETSGGDNSIGLTATLFLQHTFTKKRFSIETRFDAKFGYNRMNVEVEDNGVTSSQGIWFKNQDEFQITTSPAYSLGKNWAIASIIKFRSQFANGYVSRSQQTVNDRKSTFMAPGYLDVSGGFTYTCPSQKFPIKVNVSPLALSAIFVESASIRNNVWDDKPGWQAYGLVNPDQSSKYEGGSSIQIDFDRTFGKKGVFRYRTTLFSFMGWLSNLNSKNRYSNFDNYKNAVQAWENSGEIGNKPTLTIHPTVRWENTLDIKATKYLSTTFNFQLYYNRAQNYDIQTQLLLSVGLTYTFNNK